MKVFEMVLGGHPDKVCDIIADRIKDKLGGRCAIEVVWFNDWILVGGETQYVASIDLVETTTKEVLLDLGYDENITIKNFIQSQSQEIADIVRDVGAGDNGIFFAGYHKVWSEVIRKLKKIAKMLTENAITYNYRTDGKFIATFNNEGDLVSFSINIASHSNITNDEKLSFVEDLYALLDLAFNKGYNLEVNPKGDWHKCGGFADSGLTGRKLACDNSMGLFHQGGGAFFGKDVSKADYSIPLYLQMLAKEIVLNNNGIKEVELKAHTIIGDTKVKIYYATTGILYKEVEFEEIMDYAYKNPMDWTGL